MLPCLLAVLAAPAEVNLARGCAYTMDPPPNYVHCTDPGDAMQLTDGQYVEGYFWVQPGCVGWQSRPAVTIAIDLGQARSIDGVSFSTAAGRAGVSWPAGIFVFVSDDGQAWYPAGEVTSRSAAPPAEGYAVHRYIARGLGARGRYIALGVLPAGPYLFCDEVEVYGGDAGAAPDRPRAPVTDLAAWLREQRTDAEVRQQVAETIAGVRASIVAAAIDEAERDRLLERLPDPQTLPLAAPNLERQTLPLTPEQLAALDVQAELWKAMRRPDLTVWVAERYDPLSPYAAPPEDPPAPLVGIAMMQGEVRAAAVNLAVAVRGPVRLEAALTGLPGASARQVAWTAVQGHPPAAAALPDVPPLAIGGLTQQIWIRIDSRGVAPGDYAGELRLIATSAMPGGGLVGEAVVPVRLRVSEVAMPAEKRLGLGGWDYTDGPGRGIGTGNLDATVAFLREYGIDSPWATSRVMPFGEHDATGAMTAPPDTTAMDAWLDRWPGARWYCVFNSFGTPLADEPSRRRVTDWIDFWIEHLAERGIEPSQLCLLLADEPHDAALAELIVGYAEAVHEAQPEVVIWNDPTYDEPATAPPALFATSTMLCPNRPMWLGHAVAFDRFYLAQRAAGRRLALYSCSGPIRALDPYSYIRLQAWDAFRIGAEQSFFWSFCDAGGASAWRELGSGATCFSPQYLDEEGCTTSKHMEALRESQQDFEYLAMLRDAVAAGRGDEAWRREAEEILTDGVARVLGEPDAGSIQWAAPKDRTAADALRLAVLRLLERAAE